VIQSIVASLHASLFQLVLAAVPGQDTNRHPHIDFEEIKFVLTGDKDEGLASKFDRGQKLETALQKITSDFLTIFCLRLLYVFKVSCTPRMIFPVKLTL